MLLLLARRDSSTRFPSQPLSSSAVVAVIGRPLMAVWPRMWCCPALHLSSSNSLRRSVPWPKAAATAGERAAEPEVGHVRAAPAALARVEVAPEVAVAAAAVRATVLLVAGPAPLAVLLAAAVAMPLRPSNTHRSQRPNRSVETDAQVRPCAARTRLLCAAHLRR
jgi:hypothetical protein